jgi:AcrR family transcriptional regulator
MVTLTSSRQWSRGTRSEQFRDKIVTAARGYVAQNGDMPALLDVSILTRISIADVLAHFKTQEDLFIAVILELIDGIGNECADLARHYNPLRSLERLFELLWDQNGEVMTALAAQGIAVAQVGGELTQLLETRLRDLHDQNLVAEHVNLKALAQHHANAVVGGAVLGSPKLTPASAFRFLLDSLGVDT